MIINKIANIVNMTMLGFYSSGIKFYQVLIGLFIFNYLVYIITGFVRSMRLGRIDKR